MVRLSSCRLLGYMVLACVSLAASPSLATPIVLKEYNAPGYVYSNTPDTGVDGSFTGGRKQYNLGGMTSTNGTVPLFGTDRPFLIKFDLAVVPEKSFVAGVNSAKLRIYRTGGSNVNLRAAQLTQDWVEGTGTDSYTTQCDGAQWYNRNAGTVVSKGTFVSNGDGTWYIDGLTDLGDDPVNSGKKHIRPANGNTNWYNDKNDYAHKTTLADLIAYGTANRGYFWDSAAGRLYLNKNDINIRYYKSTDHWTTNGGPITGSYITSATNSTAIGWIEITVTSIVQNWLVSGQGNYGFKIVEASGGTSVLTTSEQSTSPTLRPELVLDLAWSPAAAPAAVMDLATSSPTSTCMTLTWTAPGADVSVGTASTYDIRYSTSAITEANWDTATQAAGEPAPAAAGTSQTMVVSGLSLNTMYHFAMKTADEGGHWSGLSNVLSGSTLVAVGPAAITTLATSSPSSTSITLTWTAPGADGMVGTASAYDIRYSTSPIDATSWANAVPVSGEPAPAVAGTVQSMVVTGLAFDTTYYFAIKAADATPNWSDLSNVPSGSTLHVVVPAGVTDLSTSSPSGTTITLSWTAPGADGSVGTASSYDIRYSTSVIDEASWASATQVVGEPAPAVAGTSESTVVSGLDPDRTYYFAMQTTNDVPETSVLSNVPTGTTLDTAPPAAITDLAASNLTSRRVTLTWTAPGDTGTIGTAASYDIRYSTGPIDEGTWADAMQVLGEPIPGTAGTVQSMTITGLEPDTTYNFAIRACDEIPNVSGLSNIVSRKTLLSTPPVTKPVLGPRDFKYKGYYIVQTGGAMKNLAYSQGFTHRYVNGQLRFLTLTWYDIAQPYVHQLIEFAPPASLGGTVTACTSTWTDFMGSTGCSVGTGVWIGLWYEQAKERLWTTWAIDYNTTVMSRSLVIRTLNANGTISNVAGPWGLEGINQRRIYGGVQAIPEWFQDCYNVGPYGTGWGGYASCMSYGVSLGPTFYAIPEPMGYPTGEDGIPTSAFKELMNHSAATLGGDWYADGVPTTKDRGVRNVDVKNDYDVSTWQAPAPDGLGRWVMGDTPCSTGCWIETPNKQGFILIPKFSNGRAWYETSTLHCERTTAEIQVFDPNMLGQVAQGARASWNTYPTYRWQITDTCRAVGFGMGGNSGNGPAGGPAATSYDSTTQTLYVYCPWGRNTNAYILVYEIDKDPAAVDDVAVGETAVTGTVGTSTATGPANRGNTETQDGVYETITEVVQSSTSQLEHKWTFDVTAGSSVVFNLKSYKTSNTEGDDFVFAYSINGTDWTDMLTVSRTTDDGSFQTYTLPGGTQGTVYVRVQDTDRTAGNGNLDRIYVDKMFFRSEPGTHLTGDINNDGYVNVGDLQLLVAAWGSSISGGGAWNPSADINVDGYVNVGDLQLLVANWGQSLP